jgi:predicted transcriptional regulator
MKGESREEGGASGMNLIKIREILEASVLCGSESIDQEIQCGGGADLMSDVLALMEPNSILLSGLTTLQVVYTAEMSGIMAICFVRGKRPSPEIVELARARGIVLLATHLPLFESCGRLYQAGLRGSSEVPPGTARPGKLRRP